VRGDRRGQNIGASLVQKIIERGVTARRSAVYLLTTTARDYFPRFGFEACSRDDAPDAIRECWEFRAGCPDTATFMRMTLGGSPRNV